MDVYRHEYEITKVLEPRTVGMPQEEALEKVGPSLSYRMGSGASILAHHGLAATAVFVDAASLALYSACLLLKGVFDSAAAVTYGKECTLSFDSLDQMQKNFVAFMRENFAMPE